jgi:hypothetical protein
MRKDIQKEGLTQRIKRNMSFLNVPCITIHPDPFQNFLE